MALKPDLYYEEHFVAFIDFLGFAAAIDSADEEARTKLLTLLIGLAEAQSEFMVETKATPEGVATEVAPNITTFSDNIVISYPLEKLRDKGYFDDIRTPIILLDGLSNLLSWLAIAALRIGFLIRGGATIGKLFHSRGVVYGEGMVEAYRIESQISVYPRIVLSDKLLARPNWKASPRILTDEDGLKHIDYFKTLFLGSVVAPDGHIPSPKELYETSCAVIRRELNLVETGNHQRAYAKWVWFIHQIEKSLGRINPSIRRQYELSPHKLPQV